MLWHFPASSATLSSGASPFVWYRFALGALVMAVAFYRYAASFLRVDFGALK
jgi:hypothetical protein